MKLLIKIILLLILFISLEQFYCQSTENSNSNGKKGAELKMNDSINEKDWKEKLSSEEFHVLREKGTERPFTGKYWIFFEKGNYKCAACGQLLFDSDTKFDAGCGWPSFSDVVNNENVILKDDLSFGMHRIEVMCSNCGGHLGHLFDDGHKPTGQRYCINSVSIKFEKAENKK